MKISDNLKVMTLPKIFKKKGIVFLLIFASLLFFFVSKVKAMIVDGGGGGGGAATHYQLEIWEPAVYQSSEMNQQSFANETIRATVASFNDQLLGCVNCPPEAQGQSAIQGVGNLIAGMYANPPASSVEYFADLGRNLGIAQPAYAQGIGFEGLRPILPIWKAFRNIAYLFFVIVFVFIGFAIMFKLKIDPQTVISIQNALPKVIVALILVTFSYAIAGLMIDLIYVAISLVVALFQQAGLITKSMGEVQGLLQPGIFNFIRTIFSTGTIAVGSTISSVATGIIGGGIAAAGIGWIAGGIALLIFAIALLFVTFKIFFQLLMSYIGIILGVIFAPLMLMLEALPGQRGLSSWLKMMLSNIIVFPLVAAVLILTAVLTGSEGWGVPTGVGFGTGTTGWVAPIVGGVTLETIQALIGFGMLLLLPSIIDMVKKAIGAPGLAEGLGAPLGAVVGVMGAGKRAYEERRGITAYREAERKLKAEAKVLGRHPELRRIEEK